MRPTLFCLLIVVVACYNVQMLYIPERGSFMHYQNVDVLIFNGMNGLLTFNLKTKQAWPSDEVIMTSRFDADGRLLFAVGFRGKVNREELEKCLALDFGTRKNGECFVFSVRRRKLPAVIKRFVPGSLVPLLSDPISVAFSLAELGLGWFIFHRFGYGYELGWLLALYSSIRVLLGGSGRKP